MNNNTEVTSAKTNDFDCHPSIKREIESPDFLTKNQHEAESTEPEVDNKKTEKRSIGKYNSRLWEVGVKLMADGTPHCGTAAVREPFLDMPIDEPLGFPPAPSYGHLYYDSKSLMNKIQ